MVAPKATPNALTCELQSVTVNKIWMMILIMIMMIILIIVLKQEISQE